MNFGEAFRYDFIRGEIAYFARLASTAFCKGVYSEGNIQLVAFVNKLEEFCGNYPGFAEKKEEEFISAVLMAQQQQDHVLLSDLLIHVYPETIFYSCSEFLEVRSRYTRKKD